MTMMFRLDHVEYKQSSENQLFYDVEEAKKEHGVSFTLPYSRPWVVNLPAKNHVVLMLTHLYNMDATNPLDLTRAEIEGRQQAFR